jgi:hypothetical protein
LNSRKRYLPAFLVLELAGYYLLYLFKQNPTDSEDE